MEEMNIKVSFSSMGGSANGRVEDSTSQVSIAPPDMGAVDMQAQGMMDDAPPPDDLASSTFSGESISNDLAPPEEGMQMETSHSGDADAAPPGFNAEFIGNDLAPPSEDAEMFSSSSGSGDINPPDIEAQLSGGMDNDIAPPEVAEVSVTKPKRRATSAKK